MIGISDRYEVVPQGGLFFESSHGLSIGTDEQTDR